MMPKKTKVIRRCDLLTVLAALVVARVSCPALSNLPIFTIAFTFAYGIAFLALFFISYSRLTKQEFKLLMIIAVYTVFVAFGSVMSGSGLFARDAFNAYVIVFLTVIFLWLKRQPRERQVTFLNLILLVLAFDYLYSIWVLIQDPNASRTAAALGVLEASPYDVLHAVGSFDLVYGSISIMAILLCMLRCGKMEQKYRVWLWILSTLLFVFVVMSAYATAFVLLLLTISLTFGSFRKVFSWIVTFGILATLIFHEAVGQWIMDTSPAFPVSDVLREKIYDLGEMLKTQEAVGTYGGEGGRAARLRWSFETFMRHPVFGGYLAEDARIGGHSEFADMLGKYGIVGFGLIMSFFTMLYREVRKILSPYPQMIKGWKIILFIFFFATILNPSLYSLQMMPIILMLPLSVIYLKDGNMSSGTM